MIPQQFLSARFIVAKLRQCIVTKFLQVLVRVVGLWKSHTLNRRRDELSMTMNCRSFAAMSRESDVSTVGQCFKISNLTRTSCSWNCPAASPCVPSCFTSIGNPLLFTIQYWHPRRIVIVPPSPLWTLAVKYKGLFWWSKSLRRATNGFELELTAIELPCGKLSVIKRISSRSTVSTCKKDMMDCLVYFIPKYCLQDCKI